MAIRGEVTLGSLVTVNGYLWMLNMPMRMAGWFVNDVQRFVTSVEKNTYHIFRGSSYLQAGKCHYQKASEGKH